MVRLCSAALALVVASHCYSGSYAFSTASSHHNGRSSAASTAAFRQPSSTTQLHAQKKRPLVLLTFDLDDTLYPIAPVIEEANTAFAKAMERYGYEGIQPSDIDETSKQVRAELDPPEEAAALSHTEARELAIRKRMEQVLLERKLRECAEDWVTRVEDLSPVVVDNAKQWTSRAVSDSIVQAVLGAWEMERHHAAERHIYPQITQALQEIKETHPDVIIGAVTDGKANPLLMTFTLAPFFDFCMSWEDDQKGRSQFFKDLASSNTAAQLSWIYNAAVEKGYELATSQSAIKSRDGVNNNSNDGSFNFESGVWIHVGDDLAYDVGGAAKCGAKTILCELADEYQQTARQRFGTGDDSSDSTIPSWSTALTSELKVRRAMNEKAREKVTETIHFITELPDAINRIVAMAQEEEAGSLLEASKEVTSV